MQSFSHNYIINPNENFTSVEEIADNLAKWLIEHQIRTIDILYGCSMGGSIVLKMIAEQKIMIKNAVCDGGIIPYQLPRLITRFIAIRDFLLISMGKIGGLGHGSMASLHPQKMVKRLKAIIDA